MSLNFGVAGSHIDFGIGNAANLGNGAFTLLALWKTASPNSNTGLIAGMNSTSERQAVLLDTLHLYGTGDFSSGYTTVAAGDWHWLGLSKAAGAAHYRGHHRDYTTAGAWEHGEASGAGNHSDPGTSDSIRVGAIPSQNASQGDVAVAGIWTSQLSDAAIEAACTSALRDFIAGSPTWAVRFQQSAPNNIQDLIGTGNESSRTGTITASADPPGFDFTIFNTIVGTASATFGALTAFAGLVTGSAGRTVSATGHGLSTSVTGHGLITSRTPGGRL